MGCEVHWVKQDFYIPVGLAHMSGVDQLLSDVGWLGWDDCGNSDEFFHSLVSWLDMFSCSGKSVGVQM